MADAKNIVWDRIAIPGLKEEFYRMVSEEVTMGLCVNEITRYYGISIQPRNGETVNLNYSEDDLILPVQKKEAETIFFYLVKMQSAQGLPEKIMLGINKLEEKLKHEFGFP